MTAAPPSSIAVVTIPCARPRDESGNHARRIRAELGNAPASPAPNRNRMTTSDANPQAAPVSAVKNDHQSTIRVRMRREPYRSPHRPAGISKSA